MTARRQPLTMKRRLLLSYLSITAFVLLILEIPLGVSYANSVERRITGDLQHDAFASAIKAQEPLATADSNVSARAQLRAIALDFHRRTGGRLVIVDHQGHLLADSGTATEGTDLSSSDPEIAAALTGAEVSGTRSSPSDGDMLYVALPVGSATGVQGAVRVTAPASVVDDGIRRVWLLLAATGGVVLGIVFLVSLLLARSMTKPLDDLRDAAAGLGNGDLTRRADVPRGPAELTVLAESFNATAAHLDDLVGAQRAFVADASHQLRTPLAALRLRLENLEAEASGPTADDLDGALAEVGRLSNLVDGLLVLARAEQGSTAPEAVDVERLIVGRAEAWEAFAAEREVFIRPAVAGHPFAYATPGRLEQVIDNLLNNALEVAPAFSSVWLVASERGDWTEVRVRDEGPGMSVDERARAFDRFWQSAVARRDGRPNGHYGLGLAIVRKLVVSDGGVVTLEESPSGGLEVVLRARRAPRPSAADEVPTAADAPVNGGAITTATAPSAAGVPMTGPRADDRQLSTTSG
jgi:signal transduction histidine kinase